VYKIKEVEWIISRYFCKVKEIQKKFFEVIMVFAMAFACT